jgi:hypothetical protein
LDATPEVLARLPVFRDQNHKWKEKLDPGQVETIRRVAREGLEYFGYLTPALTAG